MMGCAGLLLLLLLLLRAAAAAFPEQKHVPVTRASGMVASPLSDDGVVYSLKLTSCMHSCHVVSGAALARRFGSRGDERQYLFWLSLS